MFILSPKIENTFNNGFKLLGHTADHMKCQLFFVSSKLSLYIYSLQNVTQEKINILSKTDPIHQATDISFFFLFWVLWHINVCRLSNAKFIFM